jgi:Trypsin
MADNAAIVYGLFVCATMQPPSVYACSLFKTSNQGGLCIRAFVLVTGECRPSIDTPVATFGTLGIDNYIIGGTNAQPGAWPWQLSQQRQGSAGAWSHSCGASLLSATRALSASHCVDGA